MIKETVVFQPSKGYRVGFGQGLAIPGSDITYIENNLMVQFITQFQMIIS